MNTKKWFYDPQTDELFEKTQLNWWLPYALNAKDYYTVFADTEKEARQIVNARFEDKPREPTAYEMDLKSRIDEALNFIYSYGQTDGEHHKAWVIDQVVRALTREAYGKWVEEYCESDDPDGCYEWDEGIAP